MAERRKVLIIGLDGFTWRLGRQFMDEGVMPNLARLAREGCHGVLRSVIPFTTAPAWAAFMTGCRPGKTGVFSFHSYDRREKLIRLSSFSDLAAPSLWELADGADRTVVSLNLPLTSPPPPVRGVIVPGLLCPRLSPATVHPSTAYERYLVPEHAYQIVDTSLPPTVTQFVERQVATEHARCRVGLRLMADTDWDLFFHQIQSTDRLQHHLWSALDPAVSSHRPEHRRAALRFYRCCDDIIGRLLQQAGPGAAALLLSDHGFGRTEWCFNPNVWLRQKGYLRLSLERKSPVTRLKDTLKARIPPLRWLARFYGRVRRAARRDDSSLQSFVAYLRRIVDMEHTGLFVLGCTTGLVYANGSSSERAALAAQAKHELLEDFGPDSALPLITGISTGQETFGGPDTDRLPDLVLHYREGVFGHVDPRGTQVVSRPDEQNPLALLGTHSREGIFVLHGPGVTGGANVDAEIVDIAPTVLAWMGLPVPRHMDGKVITAAFDRPLELRYSDATGPARQATDYTEAEQAEVEKHLSDLGYF